MKKYLLILLGISILITGFSKRNEVRGSLFGDITRDGEVFDNVLVDIGKKYYVRLNWEDGKFYRADLPADEYKVKIYIVDTVKGSYYFEFDNVEVKPNRTSHLPNLIFDETNKRDSLIIPTGLFHNRKTIEIDDFALNDYNIENVKIKQAFLGMLGGDSWKEDLDKIATILIEEYVKSPTPERYIVVRGYSSIIEQDGNNEKQLALSLKRAKNVVSYIVNNYQIGYEHFIVLGEGTNDLLKEKDPADGDNLRVTITYESRYY